MQLTSHSESIALLKECLTNGDLGKETLYAWFCGERAIISQTLDDAQQGHEDRPATLPTARDAVE